MKKQQRLSLLFRLRTDGCGCERRNSFLPRDTFFFSFPVRGESVKRFADEQRVATFISHLRRRSTSAASTVPSRWSLFRQTFSFYLHEILMKEPSDAGIYSKLRFVRAPPASSFSSLMDCQVSVFLSERNVGARACRLSSAMERKGIFVVFTFFKKITYSYGGSLEVQRTALAFIHSTDSSD
jgi:hypothetical protein